MHAFNQFERYIRVPTQLRTRRAGLLVCFYERARRRRAI